jgi:hypothetical protein
MEAPHSLANAVLESKDPWQLHGIDLLVQRRGRRPLPLFGGAAGTLKGSFECALALLREVTTPLQDDNTSLTYNNSLQFANRCSC